MKANKARKVQTNNSSYMSKGAFADFRQALEDALDFERGQRRGLNVTRIKALDRRKQCRPQTSSDRGSTAHRERNDVEYKSQDG